MVHAPAVHLRPDRGGLIHLEAPDAPVDLHTPAAALRRWADELLRRARRVIRGLDEAEVTGYRVCVRPMPSDGQSIVGWLPGAPGVYVAVTHSGVTLGRTWASSSPPRSPAARPSPSSRRTGRTVSRRPGYPPRG